MKVIFQILFYCFILFTNMYAQFEFTVTSNKTMYDYGEVIYISSKLTNTSDSSVTISFGSYNSCQAQFQLDDYHSNDWYICSPLVQEITISSGQSRVYNWTVDPSRLGIPQSDGNHKLISNITFKVGKYFNYSYQLSLSDTIYFEAPKYLGGQLWLGFSYSNDYLLIPLKDSLDVIVLERLELPTIDKINELWQIYDYQIDSIANILHNDERIEWVEFNRIIEYDSVTVTSVSQEPKEIKEFFLSNAYPNPFNGTSRFYVEVPHTNQVEIILFNTLGEKVSTIHSGKLNSNTRYTFEIDASLLSSGVYYYVVKSPNYQLAKKVVLLK